MIIKPYYLGNTEFLKYVLHIIKKKLGNKKINLYALFNTPISIPPYSGVIDMIVDQMNLPSDRITVHTRDPNFFHSGVTKIEYELWDEKWRVNSLSPYLNSLTSLPEDKNVKRFGALFGRIQLGRILLAHHLETNHGDKSIVSFLATKEHLDHQISGFQNFFEDITEWWHTRQNSDVFQNPDLPFGEYNWPNNITTYPAVARLFQIEIVSETDYCRPGDYTEKTWRCMAIGKPFILLCGPNTLRHLQKLGFETFAPWIDESYDQISDLMLRICAIQKEIDRLASLDQSQWEHTYHQLKLIACRNAVFYLKWNSTKDT